MDDLAISPEELAQVTGAFSGGTSSSSDSSTPALEIGDLPGLVDLSPPEAKSSPPPQSAAPPPMPEPPVRSGSDVTARPVQFSPLDTASGSSGSTNLDLLLGVTLQVTVELGRTKMNIDEILHLGPGSVVELDKLAGEPVDVLVNNKMIARGEVVVLDDRFGVRITDVLPQSQRINSLR
jgi:flagellar motor switch protein FliN/FliY